MFVKTYLAGVFSKKISSGRSMIYFSLLGLCLLPLTWTQSGLQSSDTLVRFALLGDSITLPCGIPSIRSCTSINWGIVGENEPRSKVVTAGRVTAPDLGRFSLLKNCSLKINNLVLNDAKDYFCKSGALSSNVSLRIPEITENPTPAEDTVELHCFLNTFKGYRGCSNTGILIKWTTEDDTPINGKRFSFDNPSECFSKLIISKKLTDHQRKWKCQLMQNDVIKAAISYTSTITDGVEEVFAAAGESVSLSCSNTSSLGVSVARDVGGKPLMKGISPNKSQSDAFHVIQDASLVIGKVSVLHGGDYHCLDTTGQQQLLKTIRLHVLDVTSEGGPGGDNLTLTCTLICAKECEKDFNLTWSGSSQKQPQSGLMTDSNTLMNKLQVQSVRSDDITCSVHREDAVMASKKWCPVKDSPLQTPAWLALPLGLLTVTAAGGLYMYMKKKHNKDVDTESGNEMSDIGTIHVYEDVQDVNNEELQQTISHKREATTLSSCYAVLQPVN
ncbi:uncharacterized protein LOC113122729 [Mastacembelus armatus]|uniref:uncharacterized protein LOC113122729 n=1 Tax=Mastacembelus armatus TaxID=205130 RepID=UPI000E459C2A|nr:uncharacterized protein LOC113122729 [Mastacembelus armatus]